MCIKSSHRLKKMCFLAIYDGSFSFIEIRPAQVLAGGGLEMKSAGAGRYSGSQRAKRHRSLTVLCLPAQLLKHQHPLLLKSQLNLSSCFRNNDQFSYCLFIPHQKTMLPHFSTILTSRTEVKPLSSFLFVLSVAISTFPRSAVAMTKLYTTTLKR